MFWILPGLWVLLVWDGVLFLALGILPNSRDQTAGQGVGRFNLNYILSPRLL